MTKIFWGCIFQKTADSMHDIRHSSVLLHLASIYPDEILPVIFLCHLPPWPVNKMLNRAMELTKGCTCVLLASALIFKPSSSSRACHWLTGMGHIPPSCIQPWIKWPVRQRQICFNYPVGRLLIWSILLIWSPSFFYSLINRWKYY